MNADIENIQDMKCDLNLMAFFSLLNIELRDATVVQQTNMPLIERGTQKIHYRLFFMSFSKSHIFCYRASFIGFYLF